MFNKENKLTPKEISILLVYLYVILSLVFIGITIYTSVKLQYGNYRYNVGVNDGYTRAVSEAIATAGECKPFALYAGDARVDLVSIECLNQAAQNANAQTQQQVVPDSEPIPTEGIEQVQEQ